MVDLETNSVTCPPARSPRSPDTGPKWPCPFRSALRDRPPEHRLHQIELGAVGDDQRARGDPPPRPVRTTRPDMDRDLSGELAARGTKDRAPRPTKLGSSAQSVWVSYLKRLRSW